MRNELEHIEKIEKYLRNELSAADKKAFETQLKTDVNLQKEVELQQQVIKGVERIGVKQSIKKTYKKYKLGKSGFNLGLGTIVLVAAVSVFMWYNRTNKINALPELNEKGEKLWADADKYLPSQKFTLNAAKDTVIETEEGIVMYVPKGAFLDGNGKPITGDVEFEVKEAMNTAQILNAGLSSKSGDKMLESAGMFYINARKDGKTLQINKDNGIYTQVPTDEVDPDMQLFEGKRGPNGAIDWIAPKPLDKFLTPVDINSLNFYPPKYEPKLAELGANTKKQYKDSLYYSFGWEDNSANESKEYQNGERLFKEKCSACHSIGRGKIIGSDLKGVTKRYESEWLHGAIRNFGNLVNLGDIEAIKLYNEYNKLLMPPQSLSGDEINDLLFYMHKMSGYNTAMDTIVIRIGEVPDSLLGREQEALEMGIIIRDTTVIEKQGNNPAKIKAIWSSEFDNTLIATKEFEERLKAIFNTCNDAVLDVYVNNLELNLYELDEMAAEMTLGTERVAFENFAARKDGKVKLDDKRIKKLKQHYKEKQQLIAKAVAKTKQKFEAENRKKAKKVQKERTKHIQEEFKRYADNFNKEFEINLTEAYRQLGKPKPKFRRIPPSYGLTITSPGWKNVDAYVLESTANRTTLDYTDPDSGKKAVIKYEPVSVSIKAEAKYDRVLVYFLPDQLNSFMRFKKEGEVYKEKLNELMENSLICLAYIGEQAYFYSDDNISPKAYEDIELIKMSAAELKGKLNRYGNKQRKNLLKEIDYQILEVEETQRQQQLITRTQFRKEIEQAIFPCGYGVPAPAVGGME